MSYDSDRVRTDDLYNPPGGPDQTVQRNASDGITWIIAGLFGLVVFVGLFATGNRGERSGATNTGPGMTTTAPEPTSRPAPAPSSSGAAR